MSEFPIPDESKLSGIRKYLQEFVIVTLAAAVVYLFIMYHNMNQFIRDDLFKNSVRMEIIIDKNTRVIDKAIKKLKSDETDYNNTFPFNGGM